MGLLELPDLRHTLVDIGTTLLCISGYNGYTRLPDNQKEWIMQLCKCCFIQNTRPNDGECPFLYVLKIACKILRQVSEDSGGILYGTA